MKRSTALMALLPVLILGGCSKEQAEQRARQAAEKMKESIPDVDGRALAQEVDPEVVREAQKALIVVKEYQGEANGELDSVTVNAIQAFQRSRGIRDDGILDDRTLRLLREALPPGAAG
jgi:murein L,D-transpeptidase YcbB/YkuD